MLAELEEKCNIASGLWGCRLFINIIYFFYLLFSLFCVNGLLCFGCFFFFFFFFWGGGWYIVGVSILYIYIYIYTYYYY